MTTKITSANITQSGTSGISSVAWQAVQTTGFTAVAGNAYPCNTTSAAFTVTLPASPAAGNVITLTDYAGTWGTNALTVNPNGNKVNGSTASGTVATSRGSVNLVYIDSTQGWISFASNLSTSIVQAITATGGDEVKTVGAYKYHIFTSSGTFTVTAGAGIAFEVMAAGGGGGGGATVAGSAGVDAGGIVGNGGNGGAGAEWPTGSGVYYAGGGGGGGYSTGTDGTGGIGGGGNGAKSGSPDPGDANTGGGGGALGGNGGSGVVIVRYSSAFRAAASTTGSPDYTVSGGFRVYKFTGNGSITF